MPFGYSRDIFKYPPVQYIPLDPYQEKSGDYPGSPEHTHLYIYDRSEQNLLNQKLRLLNLTNYQIGENQLAVLIVNGKSNLNMYRGHEITMAGRKIPGSYQLFKVTKQYFYKDRLLFVLYNIEDNQRLDWARYEMY